MQHHRAVRIQHAFRVACGARGVAEKRSAVLIEFGPIDRPAKFSDATVIVVLGQQHKMLDRMERGLQPLDDLVQIGVIEKHAAFGMIDREGDMLIRKSRIGGMENEPLPGRGEEQFEMPVRVPCERADPIPRVKPQA